jgi:hypothetical protein
MRDQWRTPVGKKQIDGTQLGELECLVIIPHCEIGFGAVVIVTNGMVT